MPATANKMPYSIDGSKGKVEISIPAADVLFREIRIENQTGVDGKLVALTTVARLTLTLEAEIGGTVQGPNLV